MQGQGYTRRELVRRGGTAVAVAGLATGAGCAGGNDNGDTPTSTVSPTATRSPTNDGTGTSPGPTTARTRTADPTEWTGPDYGRWLPAPGTVIPASTYQFGMTDLTEYAEHVGELQGPVRDVVESWQPVDVDWRTVPLSLSMHGHNVIEADYDRGAVEDQVAGAGGWTAVEDYEGFALFRNDDSEAVAVGDAATVVTHDAGDEHTASDVARGIVDTAQGRAPTYPGESDAVDAVMDEFEDPGFTNNWIPRSAFDASPREEPAFDGQVGVGRWGRFTDDGNARAKLVVVFESTDAVDVDAVETYVDERTDDEEQFAAWRDVDVRRNGQLVVVEGTIQRDRR